MTVIKPGTAVRFPNRDLTQHHVYSFSKPKVFEIELYGGDEPNPIRFDNTGIVALGCNIHDWMLGYVYVTPDAHFGTTDERGRLTLSVEPSAIAAVTLWHPGMKNAEPVVFNSGDLPSAPGGVYELAVEIPAGDPLAFDPDPLQALFEDQTR
ncbi:MAG: hypothetical protein AAFX58_09485 [Pseudomonadota bacterium]